MRYDINNPDRYYILSLLSLALLSLSELREDRGK